MDLAVNGTERRKRIVTLLKSSTVPYSGTSLGRELSVSRQVVVQDIALLRTEGYKILATARGYMLDAEIKTERVFKVHHSNEQTELELNTIVDLGGTVDTVMVNHKVYGKVEAELGIRNRRDVRKFLENLDSGKSVPLMNITSGYHFHRVTAESEQVLDEIEQALKSLDFLAEIPEYEQGLWN